jgi:hypothetical protein
MLTEWNEVGCDFVPTTKFSDSSGRVHHVKILSGLNGGDGSFLECFQ